MEQEFKGQYFMNGIGKSIPQLFTPLQYQVPGKIYSTYLPQQNKNHSLFQYIRQLISFVFSTKLKQMLSTVLNKPVRTLQSTYSEQSLAILANSIDLHDALLKAHHYNIPLIQIVILTTSGENIVKQKLLMSFNVSHLINQNYVLYGDWEPRQELFSAIPEAEDKEASISSKEGLYFRKGELVYAFLPIAIIDSAHQHILQENLLKLRNMYYQLNEETSPTSSKLSPQPSSNFSPSSSMFGRQESSGLGENFNDSDDGQVYNQPYR